MAAKFIEVTWLNRPETPTDGVVDDTGNTFDWTYSTGFTDYDDYEYTDDAGATWTTCTAKPQPIGDVALDAGDVGVRVKATSTTPRSAPLYSTDPFTVGGGSSNVTWTGTQNASISAPDIFHSKAGYTFYANSVQSLSSGAEGSFSLVGASSSTSGWLADPANAEAFLMLASGAPYTSETGYKLRFSISATGAWAVFKDGVYVTDSSGIVLGDVISIGFDASNHLQVKKNGTPLWTDSGTTTTADYILFLKAHNEATTIGWTDVTYA